MRSENGATSHVKTSATSISLSLVGLAASGSVAESNVTPTTDAYISGSDVTSTGAVEVVADAAPHLMAEAAGLTVSTGLAVGVSTATIESDGQVNAYIDSAGKTFRTGDLLVQAEVAPPMPDYLPIVDENGFPLAEVPPSRAFAQGSAGGLLIGVDATVTSAKNTIDAHAEIRDGAIIDSGGEVTVFAVNDHSQEAESSSLAFGLIAAGVTKSTAETDTETTAKIGADVQIDAGELSVHAANVQRNTADTTAGAGGAIAGAAAIPATINKSDVLSQVGDRTRVTLHDNRSGDGGMYLRGENSARFNTELSATAGGFISGVGGDVDNEVVSDVDVRLGANTVVNSLDFEMVALNEVIKASLGEDGNVSAETGGLIAGVGLDSDTDLSLRTNVLVGNNAQVTTESSNVFDSIFLQAFNFITAYDAVTVGSGGLAAGGAVDASIKTLVDEAKVTIGDGATLTSSQTIDIRARGRGDVNIQNNSEAYGLATVGTGLAEIEILPRNEIVISAGANLRADRDVRIAAGSDTDFNSDTYKVGSFVDSFAGSAIPADGFDAKATLNQFNSIDIASGATVESGGAMYIHAQDEENNDVLAQAKAINWTSEVGSAIDGVFGAGGEEDYSGTSQSATFGTIVVDGTVRTGINRKQVLKIDSVSQNALVTSIFDSTDSFDLVLGDETTDGITIQKRIKRVTSPLLEALNQARQFRDDYRDSPVLRQFYDDEIRRIENELKLQGLLRPPAEAPNSSELIERDQFVLNVVVNPILAQAGRIDIRGDQFAGSGTIDAPGDASIQVINDSLAFLELRGLEIPQATGGLFLNGLEVSNEGDVNAIVSEINESNDRLITQNLVSTFGTEDVINKTAAFGTIVGGLNSPDPELIVRNTATETNNNPWPSITVSGPISNLGGHVEITTARNGAGSITINATISAQSQEIRAGNQGSLTLNEGTLYEAAGNAHAKWTAFDPIERDGTNQIDPVLESFIPLQFGPNPQVDAHLDAIPTTANLFAARITLTAEYINVNGLIRSGVGDFTLTIGQSVADQINSLRQGGVTGGLRNLTSPNPDFVLKYDFSNERLVVEEVRSVGGYVDLTGRIANTQNGEIQVFGGYGEIKIDNQTPHDILLKRLDVGSRGEGTVIIKDKQKGEGDAGATIYQRRGDVIRRTVNGATTVVDSDSFTYRPQNGLRYGWQIASDQLTTRTRTYIRSEFLGLDFLAADKGNQTGPTRVEPVGDPVLLNAAPYFFIDADTTDRYTYDSRTFTTSDGAERLTRRWEVCTGWFIVCTGYDYYSEWKESDGSRTIHTHTIEADRPIDIKFFGADEGLIDIKSDGDIYVTREINNPSGQVNIQTDGSIIQASRDGLVAGRIIDIDAVNAIGNEFSPIRTNAADIVLFDYSTNTEGSTSVAPGEIIRTENDYTGGGNAGSNYKFKGLERTVTVPEIRDPFFGNVLVPEQTFTFIDQADFDLTATDFSDTELWEEVLLVSSIDLDTRTGDISVNEISGDFPLNWVRANDSGTVGGDGDVFLTTQGSFTIGRSSQTAFHNGYVDGNAVSLTATTGSIGTSSQPIGVDAGYFSQIKDASHQLTASAATNIFMNHFSDLIVNSVTAGGDVRMQFVTAGNLIDGNFIQTLDERAINEITTSVWADLELSDELTDDDGNPLATKKRNERVEGIVVSKTEAFLSYWNFRQTQEDPSTYDPDHEIRIADDERVFYEQLFREQGTADGLSGEELDQFITDSITTLENSRTTQYRDLHDDWGATADDYAGYVEYWQLRNTQPDTLTYDPNHQVKLTDDEKTFYEAEFNTQGIDDGLSGAALDTFIADSIAAIESQRTARYHELHATYGARGDVFTEYRYTPKAEELAEVDERKVWTLEELQNTGRVVDFLAVTDTEFVIEDANITGRNVDIIANSGGIGRYDNGTTIDLRPVDGVVPPISLSELALLTAAEPNDIVFLTAEPVQVLAQMQSDGILLNEGVWGAPFEVGQFVFLETNTRDTTDEGVFLEVTGIDGAKMTLDASGRPGGVLDTERARNILIAPAIIDPASNGDATFLRVLRREDIDVDASGEVNVDASEYVFLGSEGDLNIGEVFAGENERVQIKVGGDLLNANDDATVNNIFGGRVVLESSNGSIGTMDAPIVMNVDAEGYLIARANEDVVLRQSNAFGDAPDLRVNQVFSQTGTVDIRVDQSIVDAFGLEVTNIQGDSIVLHAAGQIGSEGDYFDINVGEGGSFTASATGNIWVSETAGNLQLRHVLSTTGDVSLRSAGSILDAVDVVDPYSPQSQSVDPPVTGNPAIDIAGNNITLTALNGTIGVAGNEVDIDSDYSSSDENSTLTASSTGNAYINELDGDLYVKTITTGAETAFIAAPTGSIFNGNPGSANVLSGLLWLFANIDIGAERLPLVSRAGKIEGQATTGDVYILNQGPTEIGGVVDGNDPSSNGVNAGGEVSIRSNNQVTVTEDVMATGDVNIRARGNIRVERSGGVQAGGNANISTSPGASDPTQITVLGDLSAMRTTVTGTDEDDAINLSPASVSGAVRVEAGNGDDEITSTQPDAEFSGGDGNDRYRLAGTGLTLDLTVLPSGGAEGVETIEIADGNSLDLDFEDAAALGIQVRVEQRAGDPLDLGEGWTTEDPIIVANEFLHVFKQGDNEVRVANQSPYLNPFKNLDVNRSGTVTALDALLIINRLGRQVPIDITTPISAEDLDDFLYLNTNNDTRFSALDALFVINGLSAIFLGGEGEAIAASTSTTNVSSNSRVVDPDAERLIVGEIALSDYVTEASSPETDFAQPLAFQTSADVFEDDDEELVDDALLADLAIGLEDL